MPTSSSLRALRVKPRRVAFSGADVIEFDAAMAPVVHFCGVSSRSADAALECEARGLSCERQLTSLYVEELQQFLRLRGFEPMGNELTKLQTQRQVVELLLVWAASVDGEEDADVLHPATLRRAQLAKKQLDGLVDDGYAFGRRFLSVATFVETLSWEELLQEAKEREVDLPKLDKQQRAAVKALDRELLGLCGTAKGRPLRSMTLRQLVTEAETRGMLGPGDKARDSKGKRSKRAWVEMLRPVMAAEVRVSKIREKEEKMLRKQIVEKLERDQEREQQQCVVQLIEVMMQRNVDKNGTRVEPEDEDVILGQEDKEACDKKSQRRYKTRTFLTALAKSVCIPNEGQEDFFMKE
ncbi:unnamed protein product [Peronospora destructor]|uniref:Uncharacterized protein n=1 Tax=Peronospora destructor TaxID=86335 RepID=A0AAV0UJ31_9STRA|nr:unnamed protein product [Peronospora destructor]